MKTDENAPVTREELNAEICKNLEHTNRRASELAQYVDVQIEQITASTARAFATLLNTLDSQLPDSGIGNVFMNALALSKREAEADSTLLALIASSLSAQRDTAQWRAPQ